MISVLTGFGILLGPSVYFDWINSVSTRGTQNLTGYESLGFSTLLFENGLLTLELARNLSLLLFLATILFSLLLLFRLNSELKLLIIPILALMFPYIHCLDIMVALLFLASLAFRKDKIAILIAPVVILLYLPQPSENLFKNLLILCILLTTVAFQFLLPIKKSKIMIGFIVGFLTIPMNFWILSFEINAHELQVITVVRVWIIVMLCLVGISLIAFKSHQINCEPKFTSKKTHHFHE